MIDKIDSTNIRDAIERFIDGETSLSEEDAIYRFYADNPSGLPADIEKLRGMFSWYESGLDPVYDPLVTPARPQRNRVAILRYVRPWLSIAASVALVVTMGFAISRFTTPRIEETNYVIIDGKKITDPAIVNAETMKLQEVFRRAETKFASTNSAGVPSPSAVDTHLDMDNPIVRDIVNRFNNFN